MFERWGRRVDSARGRLFRRTGFSKKRAETGTTVRERSRRCSRSDLVEFKRLIRVLEFDKVRHPVCVVRTVRLASSLAVPPPHTATSIRPNMTPFPLQSGTRRRFSVDAADHHGVDLSRDLERPGGTRTLLVSRPSGVFRRWLPFSAKSCSIRPRRPGGRRRRRRPAEAAPAAAFATTSVKSPTQSCSASATGARAAASRKSH